MLTSIYLPGPVTSIFRTAFKLEAKSYGYKARD